jgi:hypothetical protein
LFVYNQKSWLSTLHSLYASQMKKDFLLK